MLRSGMLIHKNVPVEITGLRQDFYIGRLNADLSEYTDLREGSMMIFLPDHVIAIIGR